MPAATTTREGPRWAMWTRVNGRPVFATYPADPRVFYMASTWKDIEQTKIGDPFPLADDERDMTIDEMIARHPVPASAEGQP